MNNFSLEQLPLAAHHTSEVLTQCFSFIDLTSLNATDTPDKIAAMMEKVNDFPKRFPELPNVAAVCVYPNLASIARSALQASEVKIAAVGACFPSSQSFIEVKCEECRLTVAVGADEIDIVISLGAFLANNHELMQDEIRQIKKAIGEAHLKVILETGALNPEQIAIASQLSIEAGADFIKTSTGKMEPAATPEAAWIMCHAIKDYFDKTGKKIGFKPAGGIITAQDAVIYYTIVKTVLGETWLTPKLFRLGASRLANNLLTEITCKTVNYF
ncbi:MAG: deoxyribose-phosphate aldolase [Bacteroidales bacterium]|nr:deoxyribose-phosphate aldolase [Bacteroidales bacterium]MCL2133818.1 deoxyribose-phosphate aldolase [Bacteroidales bacterium]